MQVRSLRLEIQERKMGFDLEIYISLPDFPETVVTN
jgi:hypothetical protein